MLVLVIGLPIILFAFGLHWIAGVVASVICLLTLLLPVEGFHERECDELELMKLKRGTKDHTYYIELVGKNKVVFAYDNSDMYDLNGGAYEEDFRKGKIKVYESRECDEPVLKSYISRPVREVVTFAPFSTKREYVFYVPEGTVIKSKNESSSQINVEVI